MKKNIFRHLPVRRVLLGLLLLFAGTSMRAGDGVVLLLTSGKQVSFAFSSRPRIVPGDELVIAAADGVRVSYAYSEVQQIFWGAANSTAIDELSSGDAAARVQFRVSDRSVTVEGLPADAAVSIYRADGTHVCTHRQAGDDTSLRISLDDGGLYIVRTGTGVNCKVMLP